MTEKKQGFISPYQPLEQYAGVYISPGDVDSNGRISGYIWEGDGLFDFAAITLQPNESKKFVPTWTISHQDTRISITLSGENQIDFKSWDKPISGDEVSSRLQYFNLPDNAQELSSLLNNPSQMAEKILEFTSRTESL